MFSFSHDRLSKVVVAGAFVVLTAVEDSCPCR